MRDHYTLVAVTGLSPQVLTETVYALHREGYGVPGRVRVVTTGVGAAFLGALLLDRPGTYCARPIAPQGPGWQRLAAALDHPLPEIEVVTPSRPGEHAALADLTTSPDAALVADALYHAVHDLTGAGQPPLVASIAGGRKTMSADLQSAFSVYARPGDRLVHVLVRPEFERSDFLFPTPETGDAGLTLVDVRVPRLRRLLEGSLLDALPDDRRGLQGILAALAPVNYAERPARAELALRAGAKQRAELRLVGADGRRLGAVPLKASEAATLAVIADVLARSPGPVLSEELVGAVHVQRQREDVMAWSGTDASIAPWETTQKVSTALSTLKGALRAVPLAADAYTVVGLKSEVQNGPVRYTWEAGEAPPLSLDLSAATPSSARTQWTLAGVAAQP